MAIVKRAYDADVELRATSTDEALTVRGHAAVFDQSTIIGSREHGFVEKIAPGAFDSVLDNDVRYLENHDGLTMARTKNGTLRLSLDTTGLVVDADLNPGMVKARDHHAAIERSDIDQMSFAFTIKADTVVRLADDHADFPGMVQRTINRVGRLYDVSGVTYPAYEGADIGVRSAVGERTETEIRSILDRAEAPELSEALAEQSEDRDLLDAEQIEDAPMSAAEIRLRARLERRQTTQENPNG